MADHRSIASLQEGAASDAHYPATAVGKTWLELSAEDKLAELEWSIDWLEKRDLNAADQRAQYDRLMKGAD